jgi:hypothetical protein
MLSAQTNSLGRRYAAAPITDWFNPVPRTCICAAQNMYLDSLHKAPRRYQDNGAGWQPFEGLCSAVSYISTPMTRNVPSPGMVSITVIRMAVGAAAGSERLRYANAQGGPHVCNGPAVRGCDRSW